jgi:uncharacterized protein
MSDRNADLIRMIIRGDVAEVDRLLAEGADANTTGGVTPVGASNTALIWAAVNTANLGGWTPLMMAAAQGNLEIMTLLLEHNADFRPVNRWGSTALSEAKRSLRSAQAADLLIQAGAEE